ncbi:MAG: sugar transferase [Anaerovorax sp.]|nr:sugar transferase [Anaerovorax sp.]
MKNTVKRFFDMVVSAGMLMILSPILLIVYILCRIKLGSPVIFSQERPGLNGKIFKMYKFRSMTDKKDTDGKLLPDEERLTPFGEKLRATSLDELPELFNILKGEMSFVGPRPLLVKYLPRYSKEQARRHEVKPGLTGWAQVNGRNAISWEQKFELDVWYVNHWSFALDFKILWMTAEKVLKRDGISAEGQATIGEFMGSQKDGDDHE